MWVSEAKCGLIDDFAPLRVDLSDEGVFITHDNPAAPAMFYRNETPFYYSYEQELTTGPNSYIILDVIEVVEALSKAGLKAPNVVDQAYAKAVFDEMVKHINSPNTVSEAEIASIAQLASQRKSPY